jgi:hypothetical protein
MRRHARVGFVFALFTIPAKPQPIFAQSEVAQLDRISADIYSFGGASA